jgi:hypothetical protein
MRNPLAVLRVDRLVRGLTGTAREKLADVVAYVTR